MAHAPYNQATLQSHYLAEESPTNCLVSKHRVEEGKESEE